MIREIGCCSEQKAPKYFHLSQEKYARLFSHPDHVSSSQTRVPEKDMYGGAIRVAQQGCLIFSMSGLPEHGDEAVMLYAAVKLHWIERPTLEQIVAISGNPFIHKMLGWT